MVDEHAWQDVLASIKCRSSVTRKCAVVAFGGAAFAGVVEGAGPEGASTPDVVATGVGPVGPLLVVVAGPS